MKAAIFEAVGQPLRVGDLREPEAGPDEVVLRVAACGICGSDLHMTEDPVAFGIGQGMVLGHEFAGEVASRGSEVTTLAPGDRVAVAPMWGCGTCEPCRRGDPAWCPRMRLIGGGYAEYAVVASRQCRRLPEDLPTAEGALAEPVAVGLHAVQRSGLRPGARVLVLGAGPIGLTVAFWARRLGAAEVVVADLARHQEARALAIGATGFAISGPELSAELKERLGGDLPDIVFECVGKSGLIDLAVSLVRLHGTVVGVGLCVGGDRWDPFAALSKEVTIAMSAFFDMHEFALAIEALGPGRFRPQALVTDRIGFGRVPDTFEALRRRTTQCKVLIQADAA